jgi:hypothetical protein
MKKTATLYAFLLCSLFASAQPTLSTASKWDVYEGNNSWIIDIATLFGMSPCTFSYTTSSTASVVDRVVLELGSSGTPAAGFGPGLSFKAKSATVNSRDIGQIQTYWTTATDASRASAMSFWVANATALAEALRLYGNGRAMVGGGTNQACAALQVNSTTGGILPPKVTNSEMGSIGSPVSGLSVYNTTIDGTCVYDGTNWIRQSQKSSPTIAVGTGAGTGATASISGSDLSGVITITAGTSPATAATTVTVTFHTAFSTAPKTVIITPAEEDAVAMLYTSGGGRCHYVPAADIGTGSWIVKSGPSGNVIVNATEYKLFYHVIQ